MAWAVPAIAVAGAVPAFAASPIPPTGLNGWVTISRSCGRGGWSHLRIDGRGDYPDRGLWTFVPDEDADIQGATIIFYIDRSSLTFVNDTTNSGWSNLVRSTTDDSTSPAPGFYAYRATYDGTWTYDPTLSTGGVAGGWHADGDPYWYRPASGGGGTCGRVRVYARRSLTVNGETVTFTRGPINV